MIVLLLVHSDTSKIIKTCSTLISSVLRQNGKSQNRGNKETKHAKFSEKTNISYPLIRSRTCAYYGIRNFRFFRKFYVLCFLVTSVLRFAFFPYYRRYFTDSRERILPLLNSTILKLMLPWCRNQ